MSTPTVSKTDIAINKTTAFISNKRIRNFVFLILSFVSILGINAILPAVEGDSHYTANAIDVTYGEYQDMLEENEHYRLTWASEQRILLYKVNYILDHPELTESEKMTVEVPSTFTVKVYTKFFFEHQFWYISTVTSIGSSLILFYSLFNYLINVLKEKHPKYLELEDELNKAVKQSLDPVSFEPWMEDTFNKRRKIQQHISNVRYKLDVLEHRTSYKRKKKLRPYFNYLKEKEANTTVMTIYEPDLGKLSWRDRRYIEKKERLLDMLSQEYIDNNVVGGKVKYFKYIYPGFVSNGENSIGKTTDNYSLLKTDAKQISSDAGSKVAISFITTILFAVLTTVTAIASYEQAPLWIIISIISKLAPLLFQCVLAVNYSNTFMDVHLIGNLISRRSIFLLYLADMKGVEANAKTH